MNMNVVFFQQTATIDQQNLARSTAIADGSFRQLIGQATSETPIVADVVSLEKSTETNVNQLISWLEQLPEDDLEMLINWFESEFDVKINNFQQLVTGLSALDVSKIELDRELIKELVNVLTLDEEPEQDSSSEMISTQTPIIPIETYLATIEKSESSRVSHRVVAESINQVLNQFEDFSQNDAKQLLDLLKQLQATKEPISVVLDQLATQGTDQSKLTTFAKVYENFLKKTTLADKTSYHSNTTVFQQLVTGLSALDVSKIELDRELIKELVNVLTLDEEPEQDSSSEMISTQTPIIPIETYLATIEKSESSRVSHRVVAESINQVLNQFEDFSQNDAKQLLDLLKQLQATKEPISVVLDQLATQGTDQSKLTTFAKVYENFLKKTTLADKTSYHSNTTVTSKDVLKWVRAAIEQVHSTTEEQANTFGQMFSQHRTDSAIEQLQIQLGQSVETGEQLNEQLLSQFEKAISQSRFIQNLSGNNQLQLKLAPKSLGTIMVELTEIDGEMLVKLTASSQMAKEALEANVRELRHMFAPHNVVIEKQAAEPIFVEQPSPYEDMPDQHEPNEQNQQSRQTEQIDHDEETIRFEDLLNQERV